MILLTSTSDTLAVVTGSTGNIDVHASYVDYNGTVVTPGRTNTVQITTAVGGAGTTIVGSPGGSTQRNVKHVSIRNAHASTSNAITVQHYDGTTTTTMIKYTLLAGEQLHYWDERGWIVMDASGGIKNSPSAGRWLATTVKTSGTTHTVSGSTNTIHVIMVGGGGAGGAVNANTANCIGVGGGGASGGYAEKWFTVTPGTQYTCQVGAGGTVASFPAANAGGTGGQGTNSFFVVGATNVVANGGPGGTGALSAANGAIVALGGALPSLSTSGDINGSGQGGTDGFGIVLPAGQVVTAACGGNGGSTIFGGGGVGAKTNSAGGAAAASTGAGGAGGTALGINTTVATGTAGAGGVIIIEEYA